MLLLFFIPVHRLYLLCSDCSIQCHHSLGVWVHTSHFLKLETLQTASTMAECNRWIHLSIKPTRPQTQASLKGQFAFFVGMYGIVIHGQCVTCGRFVPACSQFGKADRSTGTEAK